MIRIRHVTLPPGLSAFVRRGAAGDLEVFVSNALDHDRARSAVRLALRSFRSADPRTGLLPLPLALVLARGVARVRSVLAAIRTHAVLTAGGVVAAAAVAVAILVVVPDQHGPPAAGQAAPPGQVHVSGPARGPGLTKPGHARGARSRHGTPPNAGQPATPTAMRTTSPASPQPGTSSQSGPGPRPSSPPPSTSGSPSPAPSPSPSSSSGGGGICIVVLGVWVCLG